MNRVFCVEDDSGIRELIEYTLSSTGFEVQCFENGACFFEALESSLPDIVLLDIMLPDIDGMEILRTLRSDKRYDSIPAILLTAKSERMDKIKGLDSGADDYITKPFDVLELISRIKAVLRRTRLVCTDTDVLEHGLVRLDNKKHIVLVEGNEINLTFKEYEILYMLLSASGGVVTRDSIISRVWGTDFEGESRTLDVHMRTLRQKLGVAGNCIETVRNVGYRIV